MYCAMGNFPVERIDTTQLGAVSYRVSTVDIAGGTSIIPTLVVDGREYSGFAPIRLDATVSWNYKTVRQSLRDLLTQLGTTEYHALSVSLDAPQAFFVPNSG